MTRTSRHGSAGRSILPALAAPAALTAFTIAGAVQTHRTAWVVVGLGLVVILAAGIMTWIDAAGWRLLVGLSVVATALCLACWGEPHNFGWFGMCVVAGWAALVLPTRSAIVTGAVLAALFISMLFVVSLEPGWVTWSFGVTLTTGAFIFVRRSRDLAERLRAAQSELAERARTDERHRIAREMHDLVGHSLTVALLHLGSARLALDEDIEAAGRALAEAERATRNSLSDLRLTVGLLHRSDPGDASLTPGIADIPSLIDTYSNAGAEIEFDLRGEIDEIPASRGLAAYRIVQESLTNAARHGDGGPTAVHIEAANGTLTIAVRNRCRPHARTASGTGISAMTERATALGGTLTAGSVAREWQMKAVIPA